MFPGMHSASLFIRIDEVHRLINCCRRLPYSRGGYLNRRSCLNSTTLFSASELAHQNSERFKWTAFSKSLPRLTETKQVNSCAMNGISFHWDNLGSKPKDARLSSYRGKIYTFSSANFEPRHLTDSQRWA